MYLHLILKVGNSTSSQLSQILYSTDQYNCEIGKSRGSFNIEHC